VKTVLIGDAHFKYANKKAIRWVIEKVKHFRPDVVCQMGDLYERRAFSRFSPSSEPDTPSDEASESRRMAEEFWSRLVSAAPKAQRFQLLGNHDLMPVRRAMERYPASEAAIREWSERQLTFKGVETVTDDRHPQELPDGWSAIHGWAGHGRHAAYLARDLAVGHLHRADIRYVPGGHREFCVGWVGDHQSAPFRYTPTSTGVPWTVGLGILEDGTPRFERWPGDVRPRAVRSKKGGR
jgi:hypothetical protein